LDFWHTQPVSLPGYLRHKKQRRIKHEKNACLTCSIHSDRIDRHSGRSWHGNSAGGANGNNGTGSVAGQGQQGTRGTFTITGTIAAIGSDTVTINVIRGNKLAQPYLGTQTSITVTSRTRYLYNDGMTTTTIAFADLKVGQPVSVNGTVVNNVWTAARITVGAALSCLP
jgi:hypothetical protein